MRYTLSMIGYLIRLLLKLTNRTYLIQFIDGLKFIGKPTNILYPGELLEQGALLGLSGLNNTLAIQSNQHWIWPWWVERQLNPDADEFIPTGVNLLTNNLSFRNWTALSIPGNHLEAMLDPVGMLTMEPFSWSVMPYLIIEDEYFIPSKMSIKQIKQRLNKKNRPEVITRYTAHKVIDWHSRTKALSINGEQVLQQKYQIKNQSDIEQTLFFGVSLRPYNCLTIGHIHKISCKKKLWKINGKPAMMMLTPADYIQVSNRLLGDPIYSDHHNFETPINRKKIKLRSRSGIATGNAVYKINLPAGASVDFQFLLTDSKSQGLVTRKKYHQWKTDILLSERQFRQYWQSWSNTGLSLDLPNKKIIKAFNSVKNHLCVFDDVEQFTPGSFFYHTGWFRDSAFLAQAFDQAGFFQEVKNKIPGYFKQQTLSGYFKSQKGEWDSTGQALFSVITHIRRSGDKSLLMKYYPALIKGARWINRTRLKKIPENSLHYGLLPAGLSAEHFGPNDHYYWDNFWSLSGLQQLLWCSQTLVKEKDKHWLETLIQDYSKDLQQSIQAAMQRTKSHGLPCSPYRWMDTAAIGNLAAITPMDLYSENEQWVMPTLEYLWKNCVKNGLLFQHIIHSGYNIYLSIQLAKVLLIRQDLRWLFMFKAIMTAASPTWTWPEAIHPKTGGGCMGDGDHGWAAAEFISLIRHMYVFEHQEALFLGTGLLLQWFDCLSDMNQSTMESKPQEIQVNNAPTLFGTVSYSLKKNGNDIILCWQINHNDLQKKVPVFFYCAQLLEQYQTDNQYSFNTRKTHIILTEDRGQCRFKKRL